MDENRETIVLSVGGSLVVPNDINLRFLKKLRDFVKDEIENHDRQFIIVVGGGKTARRYQKAAKELVDPPTDELDRLGISAIKLNVHLMQIIFEYVAPVLINPGIEDWGPGRSSDYGTVRIAKEYGAHKMVNLSNTDFVYDVEKMKETGCIHAIEDITWDEFISMLPEEWDPGANVPFDPIASRLARDIGLEVAGINGEIIDELRKYIHGEEFRGTRIHS